MFILGLQFHLLQFSGLHTPLYVGFELRMASHINWNGYKIFISSSSYLHAAFTCGFPSIKQNIWAPLWWSDRDEMLLPEPITMARRRLSSHWLWLRMSTQSKSIRKTRAISFRGRLYGVKTCPWEWGQSQPNCITSVPWRKQEWTEVCMYK